VKTLNVYDLRELARDIDPRLSLAVYSPKYIEVRLYRGRLWSQLSIQRSLPDLRMWLWGYRAGLKAGKAK